MESPDNIADIADKIRLVEIAMSELKDAVNKILEERKKAEVPKDGNH